MRELVEGKNTIGRKAAVLKNPIKRSLPLPLPQGSILGSLLHVLYTSDLSTSRETTLGTFADDTAIFALHENPTTVSLNLQEHLHIIEKWL